MAPMAPEMLAATSAPVEAITRAVKVEAFMPCSAADTQYASMARTCFGSGSPRQRTMNRSVMVPDSSIRCCGTIGTPTPRADCATNDSAVTDTRARSARASSSVMSSSGLMPYAGARVGARSASTRTSPEVTGSRCGSAGPVPG